MVAYASKSNLRVQDNVIVAVELQDLYRLLLIDYSTAKYY